MTKIRANPLGDNERDAMRQRHFSSSAPHHLILPALLASLALGCGDASTGEPVAPTQGAQIGGGIHYVPWTTVAYDDSVSSVHIAVTYCKSSTQARVQHIICGSHPDYALVGGGARTSWSQGSPTALLTQSHAYDDYFWEARSQDNQTVYNHDLEVYTIGMRLDGVNTEDLRTQIGLWALGSTSSLSVSQPLTDGFALSGGFALPDNAFVNSLKSITGGGWAFTGTSLGNSIPLKWSTNTILRLPKSIIEGFGALEVQQVQTSEISTTAGGVLASIATSISSGWALVGVGANARTTSGPGRVLSAISPDASDARRIYGASVENVGNSAGFLSLNRTEARKLAGSHGMCMTGTKLSASMDPCVARICQSSGSCCSNSWDASCVAKVSSVCGIQTCNVNWTCSVPAYDPAWWSADAGSPNGPRLGTNCYGYAVNETGVRQPGASHYSTFGDTAKTARATAADGLIPVTATQACPTGMTRLALLMRDDGSDYHWLRKHPNGQWSGKFTDVAPTNLDWNGAVVTNPQTADIRGSVAQRYNVFGGYFCMCSGPNQGEGKAKTAPAPAYKGYSTPWEWAYLEEFWIP